jgi:hypothetical protein
MADLKIPTDPGDAAPYSMQVALDGAVYTLGLRWNARAGLWFLDVATADGVAVCCGEPVVNGYPLLSRHKDARLPPGVLRAVASIRPEEDAGVDDLGARVALVYTEALS